MTKIQHDLTGQVAVITGGTGLLGLEHAAAIAAAGGTPVLLDIRKGDDAAARIAAEWGVPCRAFRTDITRPADVQRVSKAILARYGRVNILINNAANNPKFEGSIGKEFSRLENFPLKVWQDDLAVGLTGSFLCAQVFGSEMARSGGGVILNIASDLGVIAPNQRIYRRRGLQAERQPVKPVTYSVVKTGLIGLTRYLATYWADAGVRVNALSPGGVYNQQDAAFVRRLTRLIPMGRMARRDEYRSAVTFLCSSASSYMTGQNLIIDGGRTCW